MAMEIPMWPDPLSRWGAEGHAAHRVPGGFRAVRRGAFKDALLAQLLKAARDWRRNPNERYGLLVACAALLVCPQKVVARCVEHPLWHCVPNGLPQPLLEEPRPGTGEEQLSLADMLARGETVGVSYGTLRASLEAGAAHPVPLWIANAHQPDLAVHYRDHESDVLAVDILRAFGDVCTSDAAMLRLVALAMDALRGRLRGVHDIESLWDEVPGWIVRGRLARP